MSGAEKLEIVKRFSRDDHVYQHPREWDADLFLRFAEERAWPARDLIARIEGRPRIAFDLGCGVGTSTQLLVERFPEASITGLDSSPAMLSQAIRRFRGVAFLNDDIERWRPGAPPDLIFADGALHWVGGHETLFPRLMSYLAPGGTLAAQMPDNRQEPAHTLMRAVAAEGPWAAKLAGVAQTQSTISAPNAYHRWLRPLANSLDIWETIYVHPMDGIDAIVEWFLGSALRPFLAPLTDSEQEDFLNRYRRALESAYEVEPDGRLLFRYPRLFVLARKPGAIDFS